MGPRLESGNPRGRPGAGGHRAPPRAGAGGGCQRDPGGHLLRAENPRLQMSVAPDLDAIATASRGGIPPNRRDGRTPAVAPKRWGWLALPVAAVIALVVHYFASRGAGPLPTRAWYIFLGGALTVSLLLAALQVPVPRV